ncbi:MAG: glycosyltransferase family 2 protein [Chitinophagales bacterium]|nr:glycosyltransferase family 2 protein [Chitinophagales bacterium]
MSKPIISVITPVFNEEAIIVDATTTNICTLERHNLHYEIILVNDGSVDRSAQLINQHFQNTPKIVIHHLDKNIGMGGAVRKGIEVSQGEYIICVPSDSPLDEETFGRFMKHLDKADILVSYRKERLGYSPRMLINSWVFHKSVSVLFNINLKDYNWIHLYHRKIFDAGVVTIESNGLFMLAEILIKAKRAGFTFCEFEVNQKQRLTGIATATKLSSLLITLREMFWLWMKI